MFTNDDVGVEQFITRPNICLAAFYASTSHNRSNQWYFLLFYSPSPTNPHKHYILFLTKTLSPTHWLSHEKWPHIILLFVDRISSCYPDIFPDKSWHSSFFAFFPDRLQKVQNAATQLICRAKKLDNVQPILQSLPWLPSRAQIRY